MSVKRYDFVVDIGANCSITKADVEVSDAGLYVTYHDYALLQSQNSDLAVQLANAESKCRELAAENAGMKSAFDKPQAYLSWHAIPPTWEDPLPCGEYLDVHDEAGHKNSDGTDCWPVFAKPETETTATDAFLAEVRAQGVEMMRKHPSIKLCSLTHICDELAAQLRKGGSQ